MRIAVFGAGAVGGLLGALLSRAGHEVLLVAREEAVVAIRLDGLRLEGPHEGSYAVAATETIPEGLTTDALLVTVKAPDLARAGEEIARRLHPLPPILLLQNGLGNEEAFRSGWEAAGQGPPASSALRAVSTVPATWISPGQVREAGS
ncbi:MAG: 2-dehydropantoate 2-reductase, partial [Thermoplasmata archaeon]